MGAVLDNDVDKLCYLLEEKHIHSVDILASGLMTASEKGFSDCVQCLLKHHALPNVHNSEGFTAVILSARSGFEDVLQMLLEAGGTVHKKTFRIRATALHWAAANGHIECVELLINQGINIESQTSHGRTPLMLASRNDYPDVVKRLIDAGSDINLRDYENNSALHHAAEDGADDCLSLLLNLNVDVDLANRYEDTPLILAARNGHLLTAKCLLEAECDVHKMGRYNMSALHWAAYYGHSEVVNLLLEKGADSNAKTPVSYYGGDFAIEGDVTPLMLAGKSGKSDSVRALISAGAKVNAYDLDGLVALHYAAKNDCVGCTEALLEAGADPNAVVLDEERGRSSNSPLFTAIRNNSKGMVRELLRANACPNMIGYYKEQPYTPLELSIQRGYYDITKMLLVAGCNVSMVMNQSDLLMVLLSDDEELFYEIQLLMRNAPDLKQLCRQNIRKVLGWGVLDKLPLLPLPHPLLDYLNISELDYI